MQHVGEAGLSLDDVVSCGVDHLSLWPSERGNNSLAAKAGPTWLYPQAGRCLITGLDEHGLMTVSNSTQMHTVEECSDQHVRVVQSIKKRRLSDGQVKFLEKNFNLGSKLEPERKNQLAHDLGLQPKQVAIWYQNKRARSKTKHLEREYDTLKEEYEGIRAEKTRLENEVTRLKELLQLQGNQVNPSATHMSNSYEEIGAAKSRSDRIWNKDDSLVVFEESHSEPLIDKRTGSKLTDDGNVQTIGENLRVESDVDSIDLSCGTEQSEALDANSPASIENQQETPTLMDLRSYDFDFDLRMLSNQQCQLQHSLVYHQQGSVKRENSDSLYLNTSILPELDHYCMFSLEDVNLPLF